MADDKLKRLQVHVTMADGTEHEATIGNPDMVRFDMERPRRKWPTAGEGPILWLTFCSWAALTRAGRLDGMPFDAYAAEAESVDKLGDDDGEPVDPIPPGPEPG